MVLGKELTKAIKEMKKENSNVNYSTVNYSTLEKGTVIPKDIVETSKGGEHIYTWTIAYNIEGIRDWLFSQSKNNR